MAPRSAKAPKQAASEDAGAEAGGPPVAGVLMPSSSSRSLVPQPPVPPAAEMALVSVAPEVSSSRPLAKRILEAFNAGEQRVQLQGQSTALVDAYKVPISSNLLLEATPGSHLPPVLRLPGLVVTGSGTRVTLRHISLESPGGGALVEVRGGAYVELVDCRLRGAGVKLGPGSSAKLLRTRVAESPGPGITGTEFAELVLEDCKVLDCLGEAVHATSGRCLRLSDCTLAGNSLNGLLVDGRSGNASLSGCTISRNGQFGVWADSSVSIACSGQNSLLGNALGEVGGRGSLEGWQAGTSSFTAGDECMVWMEKKSAWLSGRVSDVGPTAITVVARVPDKVGLITQVRAAPRRVRQKTHETSPEIKEVQIKVPPDSVRLPRSGEHTPPSWSKKLQNFARRNAGLELFLREGGSGQAAWEALEQKERSRFQKRARKEAQASASKTGQAGSKPSKGAAAKARSDRTSRLEQALKSDGILASLTARKKRPLGKL
eukprot:TRINITY_DN83083_c0_g1_i1.p1 TRINITY_DN83083_c0_g1~~TRINITY_DN83083_c0_g1_i1.p1  ORF type:complete len:497 (+),score=100.36 TRINITY_DN83083_c0_g1_i1:27-1493(+)